MTQAEQVSTQETVVAPETQAETTQDATQEDRISPKLQALIRRERTAVEKERAAKAREAAILDREAKLKEFEDMKGKNPKKALEALGLDIKTLNELFLTDGETTPEIEIQKIRKEFEEYKNQHSEAITREKEERRLSALRSEEETTTKFKSEIEKHLNENKDRYELISFEGSQSKVFQTISDHYDRTQVESAIKLAEADGYDPKEMFDKNMDVHPDYADKWEGYLSQAEGQVLKISEAADKVEAELEKKYAKAPTLTKFQAFLAQKQEQKTSDKSKPQTSQTPKTLTNNLSASPSKPVSHILTDDERIAKAIAYAKGLRP